MVKQSIIDTAVRFVEQIPLDVKVTKAYLFGSCSRGDDREDSDIDIALVISEMADFFSIQMQLMRVRRKVDLRIEPHPISKADFVETNPFAYEILRSGIEIALK